MSEDSKSKHSRGTLVTLTVLFVLLLPFLPLFFAYIEHVAFGSNHVEDLMKWLGIYDLLTNLYEPILKFLRL